VTVTKFKEIPVATPDYEDALLLRKAVLRTPLGLSFSPDDLADEASCAHLGGFDEGRLVAILLLKPLNAHTVKMRQVAVQPGLQGRGIGAQLVAFAEAFARGRGYKTMIAHARGTAVEFYRRLGYEASGEPFIETTIPHILVAKGL
jgi:GNAT superfamily N-acetyltransferase